MGRRTKSLLQYAFAALLSVAICIALYRTWGADLRIPANPITGDFALYSAAIFKGMIDNAWYSVNHYVGAPVGMDLHDYPMPDLFFLLWVKGCSLFTKNPFLIANVTLILTFPAATLPALFALRRLGVRYSVALVAALLFSFSSFHVMRGLGHVLYTVGAITVPLAVLLALEIFAGKRLLLDEGSAWWKPKHALRAPGSALAAGICLVMGLSGTVYFPFFSSFMILVAGSIAALRARKAIPMLRAAALVGVIGVAFAVNIAPSALYYREHGKTTVLERSPHDSELFGLKVTQLLLPLTGHRFEPMRRFKRTYDFVAPLNNENITEYLGVVGGAGFLYLVFSLLRGRAQRANHDERDKKEGAPTGGGAPADGDLVEDAEAMRGLRVLNLATVLLATVGGFGSLIAFLVFSQIRAYNRISIYIAFFCLAALAILAERAMRRARRATWVGRVVPVALAGVLVIGVLDQTPPMDPPYAFIKQEFLAEDQFVRDIEASVPPESSVFQLPYMAFPENGPLNKLADYELFIPYLHSKTLRWSYGAMRERRGDRWDKDMADRPVAEMVDALAEAGFAGIYVARDGYADQGASVEASLAALLGESPLVNPKGNASFFSLAKRAGELRAELGDAEMARRGEEVRTPLFLGWLEGFYRLETSSTEIGIWCRKKGRMVVTNPSSTTRRATLDVRVHAAVGSATIRIEGDLLEEEIHTDRAGFHLVKTFDVTPGEHFVRITTDGDRVTNPSEADLYTLLTNPTLTPAVTAP